MLFSFKTGNFRLELLYSSAVVDDEIFTAVGAYASAQVAPCLLGQLDVVVPRRRAPKAALDAADADVASAEINDLGRRSAVGTWFAHLNIQ
jgi:hypothetical protein